jgi:hypothetical protein
VEVPTLDALTRYFAEQFFFGCEADDPTIPFGFDEGVGVRLQPMMGSDVGHYDVPDMADVLTEAYELVDRGRLSESEFQAFTFANPARFHTANNPAFFHGTVVERAVQRLIDGGGSTVVGAVRDAPEPQHDGRD